MPGSRGGGTAAERRSCRSSASWPPSFATWESTWCSAGYKAMEAEGIRRGWIESGSRCKGNFERFGGSMDRRYFTCCVITLSVALVVGTANRPEAASPENRSPTNLPTIYRTDLQLADDASPPAIPPEPKGDIELREALSLALLHNPELAAFSIEVRAAEARTLQ